VRDDYDCMRQIEIKCSNFSKCEGECGVIKLLKKHVEEYKLIGVELYCIADTQETRVWL